MYELPETFVENMKKQLSESEWEAFFDVYNQKPVKGVRLNPLKGGRVALSAKLPFLKEPVPWEENGFYTDEEKLGSSPFHFAGLFYSQEPSAMSAAPLLDVQEGEKVLDLCSAPGGKGTQLASKMNGKGIIVLNEPIFSRAKILSQNVERMGIKNAIVTHELPETLSKKFEGYFDKILIDAPCSGEGMFRKNADEALKEWSEENIALCAERQKHILAEGVKMLRSGGRLVYSTCTFALQEDEEQVQNFLQSFPFMRLIKQEKLYPHKCKGEGHFVTLFERMDKGHSSTLKGLAYSIKKETEKAYRAFENEFFVKRFAERLYEVGDYALYDLPKDTFDFSGIQLLRAGVRLGELKNGRFEPCHSLAMCVKKEECKRVFNLEQTDERLKKYLRGEAIEGEIENGWCLICVEEHPIGLGKAVNGTIKNHIPKGLRLY